MTYITIIFEALLLIVIIKIVIYLQQKLRETETKNQTASNVSKKELITKNYRIYSHSDVPGSSQKCIVNNLLKMDKTNPKQRAKNKYDAWFIKNVEKFYQYPEAMAIIDYYGYLTEVFIDNLHEPWKNVQLQKRLVSIDFVYGMANFSNTLCLFLKRWDLLPEIKNIVLSDSKFYQIKHIYELFRSNH